ncbi:MAG: TerB family tellurite resistance protein [Reichenbachiella sp.]
MMVRKQLTALAQLAKTDDSIDESELNLIFRVGRAHKLEDEEIQAIIDNPGQLGSLADLSEDEKFEFLYSVIQLMKVDDEIFNAEIDYCNQIAVKLGYGMGAVMEMYPVVHKNLVIRKEKENLKSKVRQFLKH